MCSQHQKKRQHCAALRLGLTALSLMVALPNPIILTLSSTECALSSELLKRIQIHIKVWNTTRALLQSCVRCSMTPRSNCVFLNLVLSRCR